jgi:hypothetical protein
MSSYAAFLESKAPRGLKRGMKNVPRLSAWMHPLQRHCVQFALECGSSGEFLDTGLGKTGVQLEFAEHARHEENGKALILTPLAVAKQFEREGKKWGYDAFVIRDQSEAREGINICNYDRLHLLDPNEFGVITLDEAALIKNFSGKVSRALINAFANHRWRMPATATPAPNSHMELGQYSEFCGIMQSNEMLSRFFINDTAQASQEWRLKKYGVEAFWDWIASWSRVAQLPSDLGFDDTGFVLPPIDVVRHRAAESAPTLTGGLFGDEQVSATNMHTVKRATAKKRSELAVEIVYNWQLCGNLNTPQRGGKNINRIPPSGTNENPKVDRPKKTNDTWPTITEKTQTNLRSPPSRENLVIKNDVNATRMIQNFESQLKNNPGETTHLEKEKIISDELLSLSQSDSQKNPISDSLMSRMEGALSVGKYPKDTCDPIIATEGEPREAYCAITVISHSDSSKTAWNVCKEPWCIWVDTDYEQNELEHAIANVFGKDSFYSVRGSQSSDVKESSIYGWIDGQRPIMIGKPSMLGHGLNFQHCCRTIFVGRSFSYQNWYQAVRRFWRFGQERQVQVHLVVAEGEDSISRVIDRKADDHAEMKTSMRAAMKRANGQESATRVAYEANTKGSLPSWIA